MSIPLYIRKSPTIHSIDYTIFLLISVTFGLATVLAEEILPPAKKVCKTVCVGSYELFYDDYEDDDEDEELIIKEWIAQKVNRRFA